MNEQIQKAINNLFDELVPIEGKADSKAGEIVRAVSRIGYRFYNDGDQIGIGYGKKTCNAAARFLSKNGTEDVVNAIENLWECYSENKYEEYFEELCVAVLVQLTAYPELRKEETEDMFDCFDIDEDREDEEDCEEEYEYEDEYESEY